MSKRSSETLLCGLSLRSLRLCVECISPSVTPLAQTQRTQIGTAKKSVAFILLLLALAGLTSPAHPQNSKQAKATEILNNKCLVCHEIDLIKQQRLSRAGWTREVDKMIRWGASISDAEKEPLLDYLTDNFPAQAAKATPASSDGKVIFEKRCTICHEADIVEGQRLSRTGWTREVEKMVRWGATVEESEKAILVDYLSTLYPVRPLHAK
jgi:cytochrome c2